MAYAYEIAMERDGDQRNAKRCRYCATIGFSYFNRKQTHTAELVNFSQEGMCFKSKISLKPGATVFIRLKETTPLDLFPDSCSGLRSTTLAEIKWCREIGDDAAIYYEIGVRYLNPW